MKRRIQIVVGLLLGGVLVWWLFRGTEWPKVFAAIRASDPIGLALAEVLCLATFLTRVQRWSYIVRSVKPVPFRSLFSATQIGFMANFTLPGRVGEVIRAVVLAKLARIPFVKCFAFVALDRLTDLFGLVFVLVVSLLAFRPESDIVLPPEILATPIPAGAIQSTALTISGLIVVLVIGCVMLFTQQHLVLRLSDRILSPISGRAAGFCHGTLQHLAEGMHIFRSYGDIVKALSFSWLTWLLGTLHYGAVLWAFGIEAPWFTPFVVMSLLAVAISLPGPPGFVGPFHIAIVGAVLIVAPGTDIDTAKAAAIVAHLLNLVPVVIVGLWCIYIEQFGMRELRREGAGEVSLSLEETPEHSPEV